jgi:hypothetical protein
VYGQRPHTDELQDLHPLVVGDLDGHGIAGDGDRAAVAGGRDVLTGCLSCLGYPQVDAVLVA